MPLWSVDIEKQFGETWTNRYIINHPDLAAAVVASNLIVACEAVIHTPLVTITRHRVSSMVEGDDVYQIVADGIQGTRNTTGEMLPLFNTVRVDFTAIGGGRPSRKYLRLPLTETDANNANVIVGLRTIIQNSYITPLLAPAIGFVDVDGQPFANGSVLLPIQMRQLRRGSRRKTVPVLG